MSRKRNNRSPGPFAQIPLEVLHSEAHRSLNYSARATLVVLASQFNGIANGCQRLTPNICEQHGLSYSQAKRDAMELERRGLVVLTMQGGRKPLPPTQHALAWRAITHLDNRLLDTPRPAPNEWVRWMPGADFSRRIPHTHSADSAERWFFHSADSAQQSAVHSADSANILESTPALASGGSS